MRKKEAYTGIVIVALLLIISLVTLTYDYKLALQGTKPKFAIKTVTYKDGGTSIYIGFGYKITDYNQMKGRNDIQFSSPFFSDSLKEKSFIDNH